MRKLAVFILAIIYIMITSGIVMNIHFCMGQIASVKYGYDTHKKCNKKCSKCGMTSKMKGCCRTEYKLLKVDDVHQQATASIQILPLPAEIPAAYLQVQTTFIGTPDHFIPCYHAPPDPRLNHVYLNNCVFRI